MQTNRGLKSAQTQDLGVRNGDLFVRFLFTERSSIIQTAFQGLICWGIVCLLFIYCPSIIQTPFQGSV